MTDRKTTDPDPTYGCLAIVALVVLSFGLLLFTKSCDESDCTRRCALDDRTGDVVGFAEQTVCWCLDDNGKAYRPTGG